MQHKTMPQILAHRALGFGYRENTLRALKEALFSDVHEIELDFRLTKDNIYICNHDPELKIKLKSGKIKRIMIRKKTIAELNEKKKRVASLEEILAYFAVHKQDKIMNIDLKDCGEEKEVIKLVKKYKLNNSVIIISWLPKVLERIRRLDKKIKISFSYAPAKTHIFKILKRMKFDIRFSKSKKLFFVNKLNLNKFQKKQGKGYEHVHIFYQLPKKLIALKLDSINIPWYLVNKDVVREAHKQNIKVRVFSVDSKKQLQKLKGKKIDTIFTNEIYEL